MDERGMDARVTSAPHPFAFFERLVWLDGRPLMATIEPYRREIIERVLWTFDAEGAPQYNLALLGRAKKNFKSTDVILMLAYRFFVWPSDAGNDCFLVANDEDQAGDTLALLDKLVARNPILSREVDVQSKAIIRKDGKGSFRVLPSRDAAGEHGKTFLGLGLDEIWAYRNYNLIEALAPDPSRRDVLTVIASYAPVRDVPGMPLHDFFEIGKNGADPRMFFSWYSAKYCTDSAMADATPEQRANPSMASWKNAGYLDQQKRRLPTHKYRRLHLNLAGAPDGAAFSAEHVMSAIVAGRKRLLPEKGRRYVAFVDMSGGSSDWAILGVSYLDKQAKKAVLACLVSQTGAPPFNPRSAVKKFAGVLREYGVSKVTGDAYAGQTFRRDFEDEGVTYIVSDRTKSEIYDLFEPELNAGAVEILDIQELQDQLLTLVIRGSRIDHQPGDHDDWANAAAGALVLASEKQRHFTKIEALVA